MTTKPNASRPYKAIAAALVAVLGVLVAQGQDTLPPIVLLIVTALIAGLITFVTPAD